MKEAILEAMVERSLITDYTKVEHLFFKFQEKNPEVSIEATEFASKIEEYVNEGLLKYKGIFLHPSKEIKEKISSKIYEERRKLAEEKEKKEAEEFEASEAGKKAKLLAIKKMVKSTYPNFDVYKGILKNMNKSLTRAEMKNLIIDLFGEDAYSTFAMFPGNLVDVGFLKFSSKGSYFINSNVIPLIEKLFGINVDYTEENLREVDHAPTYPTRLIIMQDILDELLNSPTTDAVMREAFLKKWKVEGSDGFTATFAGLLSSLRHTGIILCDDSIKRDKKFEINPVAFDYFEHLFPFYG
jgi:hypothetical protein